MNYLITPNFAKLTLTVFVILGLTTHENRANATGFSSKSNREKSVLIASLATNVLAVQPLLGR